MNEKFIIISKEPLTQEWRKELHRDIEHFLTTPGNRFLLIDGTQFTIIPIKEVTK